MLVLANLNRQPSVLYQIQQTNLRSKPYLKYYNLATIRTSDLSKYKEKPRSNNDQKFIIRDDNDSNKDLAKQDTSNTDKKTSGDEQNMPSSEKLKQSSHELKSSVTEKVQVNKEKVAGELDNVQKQLNDIVHGRKGIDDFLGTKELASELKHQELMGKRGEAWFFCQIMIMLLIVFPPVRVKGVVEGLGALAVVAGIGTIAYAFMCLGKSFSPLPEPRQSNKLVSHGIYGVLRHPQYGGLILISLGISILSMSETRLLLTLLFLVFLDKKAQEEEKRLEARYGQEYSEYLKRVHKRMIPFVM